MRSSYTIIFCLLLLSVAFTRCKKLVDVPPPRTGTTETDVYQEDATATAVLTGIYAQVGSSNLATGGLTSMSLFPGLSADELVAIPNSDVHYRECYLNTLVASDPGSTDFWTPIYNIVYTANSAITGISNSNSLTAAVRKQLLGEAKFMRAFSYFYLTNLYGDVPLVLTTDYTINSLVARSPQSAIYSQIVADATDAQTLLSPTYLDGSLLNVTADRVRPTKWAASALLARVYLYEKKWDSAAANASIVVSNSLFSLDSLNGAFLKATPEAIWQLMPLSNSQNTPDGSLFILPPSGPDIVQYPFYLNMSLVNAFEPGDNRRTSWIDSAVSGSDTYYYPFKYKQAIRNGDLTEYSMVMRLAEQYLIRAEARAQEGDAAGAQADLNVIRERAGLPDTTATGDQLINLILHERQVELFTEWGHRWLDLKRTGSVDAVMGIATQKKGGSWKTSAQLYPITVYDLKHDPSLKQNPGY